MIAPRTFSDENGQYVGMDGKIHSTDGHVQYTDFSGWDVYRTDVPLLALLLPARTGDLVRSLLNDADQSGCLPKWAFADGQTMEMIGDPADPAIASAAALGATGFDPSAALAAMRRGATRRCHSANGDYVERQGLTPYRSLGYIPIELNHQGGGATAVTGSPDSVRGSAATTLDYQTADFSIAQFAARTLGDRSAYQTFMDRAGGWTRSFDRRTGYIEPRHRDGAFPAHFSPVSKVGFVEGDAAQYRWLVPYDLAGLANRLGGSGTAARRLDRLLAELNDVRRRFHSRHALLGNEPTLLTPWIYDWLKAPFETQRAVRRAVSDLYDPSPSGYPGNDDLGALSSWYVFGALGLYPAVPGTGVLVLSSPTFPRATLHLPGGDLMIDSSGPTRNHPYVRRLHVDGHLYRKAWLPFCSIASGGRLNYRLSSKPRRAWGAKGSERPPSFNAHTPFPSRRCEF
jgi:predicted alpha-1,2-mannosidase